MKPRGSAAALAVLAMAGAARAQEITPLIDTRLRWEHVEQDGLPRGADAVTLRARTGVQASRGPFSALVESEETLALDGDYFDGLRGDPGRATVLDPQDLELNRAQIRYAVPGTALTAGRQAIELADQRFVGSASWRQNQQTFDAVRGELTRRGLSLDISYARAVRTTNGDGGYGARPVAIGGDNLFALAGVRTPIGQLTGFAYLVDQNSAAVQGFRLSGQSYGIRLAGDRPFGGSAIHLAYALSAARQSDWARNPNRYGATYYLAEGKLIAKHATATLGYEVLGAARGAALTSFQTPLASAFRFQGWAGKFTTTPPDGVRDLYAGGEQRWLKVGPVDALTLQAVWHVFDSDRLVRRYGTEIDLLAAAKRGRTTLAARYARYSADRFATDTDKAWLSLEWSL
jgi:hypothetical protein